MPDQLVFIDFEHLQKLRDRQSRKSFDCELDKLIMCEYLLDLEIEVKGESQS